MIPIEFTCTQEIEEFVREIAANMVHLFDISLDEAMGRINRQWRGQTMLREVDEMSLFHEEADWWAKTIYYGPGVLWWLGEEGLSPRPYP
jgi:hypothetical protein